MVFSALFFGFVFLAICLLIGWLAMYVISEVLNEFDAPTWTYVAALPVAFIGFPVFCYWIGHLVLVS